MQARSVVYKDEINKAAELWGVDQALLQSMVDFTDGSRYDVCGLPEAAKAYAHSYALKFNNTLGYQWPEANIIACAWWIVRGKTLYGDVWDGVKAYFEMSPVGDKKMEYIRYQLYPKWARKFR